jgi:sporulation protein YlmC with PRC-barrel domain
MANKPTTRLRELRGSGFEIAKGQPDIRGWDVRDDSRRMVGKVRELIFDLKARKVRYMVVDIGDVKELELEKRTVLIPIGFAQLDSRDDDVIIHNVTPYQLRALPRYDKNHLGAKVDHDVSQVFGRPHSMSADGSDTDDSFYEHDYFNENNMNKRRTAGATSSATTASDDAAREARRQAEERQREKDALRREAEVGEPVSFTDPDDVKRLERQERRSDETEEDYLRRTRR